MRKRLHRLDGSEKGKRGLHSQLVLVVILR